MGVLHIPARTAKPRNCGWTLVNDRGVGLNAWKDTCEMAGDYVDFAKLGIGTAYVMHNLEQKISCLQSWNIEVTLGGTLFETYWAQGQLSSYHALLEHSGLRWVEISSGSYAIPLHEKVQAVREFSRSYQVMAEVGRKEDAEPMTPAEYAVEAQKLSQAGAAKIIVEGRGTGTGGMYDSSGAADRRILDAVLNVLPVEDIIFEAPQEAQQIFFIREYGPNVNLANIPFDDVLFLETERVGLRFDTIPDEVRRRSS